MNAHRHGSFPPAAALDLVGLLAERRARALRQLADGALATSGRRRLLDVLLRGTPLLCRHHVSLPAASAAPQPHPDHCSRPGKTRSTDVAPVAASRRPFPGVPLTLEDRVDD